MTLSEIRNKRLEWKGKNVDFDTFQQQEKAGKYYLDPPHQRNVVHDNAWKSAILSSALIAGEIPATYWHPSPKDPNVRESLDGKQRCAAVLEYMNSMYRYKLNDISGMKGRLYSELPRELQREINVCNLTMLVANRTLSEEEIAEFFGRRQETKRTSCGEHLNSCVHSQLRKEFTPLCKSLERDFKDSGWVVGDRFEMLERVAQIAFVSFKDAHKGSGMAVLPPKVNKPYDPESAKLKLWWPKALFTESQLNDAVRLIKAVLSVQSNAVIFQGGNGSKNNVLACAYYIQRFCWDKATGRIDEDALKRFATRLIKLTYDHERIELGTVGGEHSGQPQRDVLVELVNQR
jgi:hypothetical protein